MIESGPSPKSRALRRAIALALLPAMLSACASADAIRKRNAANEYRTITVRDGDTLSEIADRYDVAEADVARANRLSDRDRLHAGQRLDIPPRGRDDRVRPGTLSSAPPSTPSSRTVSSSTSYRAASNEGIVPVPIRRSVALRNGYTSVAYQPSAPAASSANTAYVTPSAKGAGTFAWPVKGSVLSPFGRRSSGERNDGINIAAVSGAPVRAAAAGTVTYVGNELKGYGNLVLIRHDEGFVTAYAHSARITVARGERVTQGQIIAYAGETGDVTEPQVHFEIRRGTTPVDPRAYLVAMN